jgi:flagellar biosynthesis protein FlhA
MVIYCDRLYNLLLTSVVSLAFVGCVALIYAYPMQSRVTAEIFFYACLFCACYAIVIHVDLSELFGRGAFWAVRSAIQELVAEAAEPRDIRAVADGSKPVKSEVRKAAKDIGTSPSTGASGEMASLPKLEKLTLEVGFQLIPLVDEKRGGQLLSRLRALRRHLSQELGFLIPPVHITDNLRLKPREYLVSLRGIEIGRWQVELSHLLAVSAPTGSSSLPGKETREPAFGVPAVWITPDLQESAIAAGCSVVDAVTVIATHLGELIQQHAHELLGRAETKRLLGGLKETDPDLVEELVPKLLTLGETRRVLQQLLRERVSIRDIESILEALIEAAPSGKNLVMLVEAARHALGPRLVQPLLDAEGRLPVLLLDPALEGEILLLFSEGPRHPQLGVSSALSVPLIRRLVESLKERLGAIPATEHPALLCPSPARYDLKRLLEPWMPRLAVLDPADIPLNTSLLPLGSIV